MFDPVQLDAPTLRDNLVLPAALVAACFVLRALLAASKRKSLALPPSPPASRWLGHDVLSKYPFLRVNEWINEYGPVISLRMGRTKYVVIGRHQAAVEIMEKQGGSLVDRPRFIAAGELLGGGLRTLLTPTGPRLKRMRKALHSHLQPKAAQTYERLQTLHAHETILRLLDSPERYQDHVRAYAASVILKVAYGKNTSASAHDGEVVAIRQSLDRFRVALRPGAYLVDVFPFLKYLPWYGRELRRGLDCDFALFRHQLDGVKREMNDQDSGPSFAKFLLERNAEFGMSENEMAFLAGGLFGAGSDTTALAICTAIMAAACHPEAQALVHAELDQVIGTEQVPTFDDEASLPVLRAFILESMRWRPLVPMGLPHRATQDIIWGEYCIPAGTTVYGNHWAISRDPEVFPDPETFNLGRWLDAEGKVRDDVRFPYFGFGRRVCPGQHVATRSIFINTLLILWSFRLSLPPSPPTTSSPSLSSSKRIDDMAFMMGVLPGAEDASSGIRFEPRMERDEVRERMRVGDD
ncbi:cytochrome P450 [Phlebopus sp. FC_14]|nr:cytochrome P450 [Phlebopus sp. FC_14]